MAKWSPFEGKISVRAPFVDGSVGKLATDRRPISRVGGRFEKWASAVGKLNGATRGGPFINISAECDKQQSSDEKWRRVDDKQPSKRCQLMKLLAHCASAG